MNNEYNFFAFYKISNTLKNVFFYAMQGFLKNSSLLRKKKQLYDACNKNTYKIDL